MHHEHDFAGFDSPGPGDFKTVFIILHISRILFWQSLGSPVVKFFKNQIYSCGVSKDAYWNTELNIESIFINVEYCAIGKRKTVIFGNIRISQRFLLPDMQSVFQIFEKLFDIWFQCFNTTHDYIKKKNNNNLLQGIPNFEVRIFEKYSEKL